MALALAALGAAWVTTREPLGLLRYAVGALGVVVARPARSGARRSCAGDLGTTPIFNWLLWGYGVPGARLRRRRRACCAGRRTTRWWRSARAWRIALTGFLVVFEIRHARDRRGIDAGPGRAISKSASRSSPSLVFAIVWCAWRPSRRSAVLRIGSYVFGGLSLAGGVFGPALVRQPAVRRRGELIRAGRSSTRCCWPILLPALAAFALARSARERRPRWFVLAAAALGSLAAVRLDGAGDPPPLPGASMIGVSALHVGCRVLHLFGGVPGDRRSSCSASASCAARGRRGWSRRPISCSRSARPSCSTWRG